jgi:hypothetical protein
MIIKSFSKEFKPLQTKNNNFNRLKIKKNQISQLNYESDLN